MPTLVLQVCVSLLRVAFAVYAVKVALQMRRDEGAHREAWLATAVTFVIYGANMVVQDVVGVWAYFAGPQAPVFAFYLRMAPVFNHMRTFMMFAFYGAFLLLPLTGWPERTRRKAFLAGLGATIVAGSAMGWLEGALTGARHLPNTAFIDIAAFALLGAALMVAMFKDTMDRYLWLAIALYGFTSILGVLYLTALSWFGSGQWTPPVWQNPASKAILAIAMVWLAARRLQLARRGARVSGLMPPLRSSQPMLG